MLPSFIRQAAPSAAYGHDDDLDDSYVKSIRSLNNSSQSSWIRSILYPEFHCAKVPSVLPQNSALAALDYNFTITPNASGKFLLVIDPLFATGALYNDATVNGTGGGVVTNLTFPQDATLIDEWRLASSSLLLRYFGQFSTMGGLFVAAVTNNRAGASAADFLNFSLIESIRDRRILQPSDGVKLIWSPDDSTASDYSATSVYTAGTHAARWQNVFVIYGDGFPNTANIRCDLYRNIEYKSKLSFREYINHTSDNPAQLPYLGNFESISPLTNSANEIASLRDKLSNLSNDIRNGKYRP